MATSQPIALPASNPDPHDYTMGSYSADTGAPFNPASYTRHFLGSPISWRAGSFGARIPQNSPSAQLFSALDHPKSSSSIDEVSVINAFNVFDREGELCRNYNCCGIHLPDLHALLEHFEEVHVLVVDPTGPAQISVPFNPQPIDQHPHHHQPPPFDSDDMELELDLDNSTHPQPPPHPSSTRSSPSSSGPSPPHTPAQFAHQYATFQHHSPFPSATTSPYASQPPSPGAHQNVGVHFPNAGLGPPSVLAHPEEAFNAYARFAADYSSHMPGTQFNASGGEEIVVNGVGVGEYGVYQAAAPVPVGGQQQQGQQCIPPALLFASTSNGDNRDSNAPAPGAGKLKLKVRGGGMAGTNASAPATPAADTSTLTPFAPAPTAPPPATNSNNASFVSNPALTALSSTNSTSASTLPNSPVHTPSHTPLPPTTSLLLSKPFRCPKPNCNKSYKQANGLKYHMTHGSCNFAPPKDLEHVKDLLERKRREREANAQAAGGTSTSSGLARSASLSSIGRGSTQEPFLQNLTHSAYGDLGSITETELREVEREAEKRVRPFACGVGDCQRRYKNMNGLRYHYQHSGDHGAVGLALLAGGLHECLGNNQSSQTTASSNSAVGDGGKGKGGKGLGSGYGSGVEEREGRKRAVNTAGTGGVQRTQSVRGGSASVPVSRAGSISRVGTPVLPVPPPSSASLNTTSKPQQQQQQATTPFTPGYTNPAAIASSSSSHANAGAVLSPLPMSAVPLHSGLGDPTTPPLTPLTAAVQGLGLGSAGVRSQPHSPTHHNMTFAAQQQGTHSQGSSPHLQQAQQQQQQAQQAQQAQLAYQAQFVELQRRQYMQMQAQAAAQQQQQGGQQQQGQNQFQAQFQQQLGAQVQAQAQVQQQFHQQSQPQQVGQQQQGQQGLAAADAQAQQDFVEAQRREFELQMQQAQVAQGMQV
ncbi:hypothetical protein DXG03_005216 [Asterophora parasitica]|uniref:C2H2-type domain-containing protein n=1 Tax=Asterophora parasitica TaxID=117018 RepID=A0A9P7G6K7_9AGAR|nr:hypothetical protein DXG03_005216 [Asterophora parasitica]